jgi:hypothetical protein
MPETRNPQELHQESEKYHEEHLPERVPLPPGTPSPQMPPTGPSGPPPPSSTPAPRPSSPVPSGPPMQSVPAPDVHIDPEKLDVTKENPPGQPTNFPSDRGAAKIA